MTKTRYPEFDVMREQQAWDTHTRAIVAKRLETPPKSSADKGAWREEERALLQCVLTHLLYEDRDEILSFVTGHFEQTLGRRYGEAQRKRSTPAQDQLVAAGLDALDDVAKHRHAHAFTACETEQQYGILHDLQLGRLEAVGAMAQLPQKELFTKLLSLAAEAYASHPTVWSEMGYAGPAYPRGYYRIESGLRDPWEPVAERNEEKRDSKNGNDVQERGRSN